MLVTLQKLRRTNRKVYLWLLTLGVSIKLQILQAVYLTNELRLFFFLLKKRNSGFISHVHFDLLLCLSSFLFFLSSTSTLCLCLQIIFPFLTPVAFFFMSLTFIHFFLFYVPFLIVLLSTTIETVSHFSSLPFCAGKILADSASQRTTQQKLIPPTPPKKKKNLIALVLTKRHGMAGGILLEAQLNGVSRSA